MSQIESSPRILLKTRTTADILSINTFTRLRSLLTRHLRQHFTAELVGSPPADAVLCIDIDPALQPESFRILSDVSEIYITGADALGLLYGIGKWLRLSAGQPHLVNARWAPDPWQFADRPLKPVRGIYFATHFHNSYHDAPLESVQEYIKDIALWGFNALSVWFDMHTYRSIDDPAARRMLDRLRAMLRTARELGLQTSITLIANEAYMDSPPGLRADWTSGHDGYFQDPAGHYHVELCPGQPGAIELLLEWRRQVFEAFQEIGLDYIWIWPYDQGGCTCARCAPWGTNGFLRLAPKIAEMARACFPSARIVLSTWYFDHFVHDEWSGLERLLAAGVEWLHPGDYLMAELLDYPPGSHTARYPQVLLQRGVPGGFPLLGFPEISMYGATPWGGFGANPLPAFIQDLMAASNPIQDGGFPYSEGIFEDINKTLCAQLYWDPSQKADDILREYLAYELADVAREGSARMEQVVGLALEAIRLMERSLPRQRLEETGEVFGYNSRHQPDLARVRFVIEEPEVVEQAFALLQQVNDQLPARLQASWRWRILYLRGLIDRELVQNQGLVSKRCESAFAELVEIYHAQDADYAVSPPTVASIAASRGL